MDLAQAASIFKKSSNFKALGICYNNIANIQYKNSQYHEAAQNFKKAIVSVEKVMEDLSKLLDKKMELPQKREAYKAELTYFEKVRAHRVYQYAMSRYKLLRYTPNNIKDKKINWQQVDFELRQALEKYNEIKVKVDCHKSKK